MAPGASSGAGADLTPPSRPSPRPGGYHWQDPALVERAVPDMQRREAERAEELGVLLRALPLPPGRPSRVLDLGAGYGALTRAILHRFPQATAVCLDFSPGMVAAGEGYLRDVAGRYAYAAGDLNSPAWPAGVGEPFDAVVSSQAIHHLADDRKRALFREVLERLLPGGAFFNIDPVRPPNAPLQALYWAGAEKSAWDLRERLAAPAPEALPSAPPERHVPSLAEQLDWVRAAGFVSVDCLWRRWGSALYGGYRPLSA